MLNELFDAGQTGEETPMQSTKKTSVAKRQARPMAVLIRDRPPTFDWGWFSREDPRMHIQTVDKDHRHLHHKVWLENKGRRIVQPEPGIPAKVLKVLQEEIAKQRGRIE